MRGLDNAAQTYDGRPLEHLTCFGCAHSAASEPWPGQPSGERPCGFCVRNRLRATFDSPTCWYDGTPPVRIPMDCYHSLDMSEQTRVWMRDAETCGQEALSRLIALHTKLKDGTDGRH